MSNLLRTYKIKNRTKKITFPTYKDISKYGKQELFLIVANTEKYYKLRNDVKLLELLKNDFKYTNNQIKYLINNIDLI